ncbi:MAG: dihydroneopterin aldolase [Leptolyngbyaceae cyanobacterium CSU_1_4]|nr:dihydroneopterin aldolase [Leptolyngbyaceae cyanobacterium CSU_1_4]
MKDAIYVNGIRAFGYLGVLPEERTMGQWFNVDLIIQLDLSKAGASDRLDDTYDYCNAVTAIQNCIQTSNVQLLESAAERIAAIVLTADRVQQVQVRLTKLVPPIPDFSGTITVEVTRSSR